MRVSVAIVGATGLVGSTLLQLLEEQNFHIDDLYLVASHQSAGKVYQYKDQSLTVSDLADFDFTLTNLAFFCVGSSLSEKYIPIAVSAGNRVIDKSDAYRIKNNIPLIIPEVNLDALKNNHHASIIANPNCNTIPIAVALKPIYDAVGVTRVNISTYQSVSGTGKEAVHELIEQSKQVLNAEKTSASVYPEQIAFNVLPHIDSFEANGYTKEEMKMVNELKKIFNDDSLMVNPTAVRVPVYVGHSASLHIETKKKISQQDAIELLSSSPGLKVINGKFPYPTPVKDAAGCDDVLVGRIREDISHPSALNLWVVADNLRKGAALNALQIAENLLRIN